MRLLIHDFAGHAFPIHLSRILAKRGHWVLHVYARGLQGPKGALERTSCDPAGLQIHGIQLSGHFRKYSPIRRLITQRAYARELTNSVQTFRPDVVLSGNTPIDIQAATLSTCRRQNIAFVHWVQDIYFLALQYFISRKLPFGASLAAIPFRALEKSVCLRSDSIIVIAEAFRKSLRDIGVDPARMTVLENWAPLEEFPQQPRRNSWSELAGFGPELVFLYSGTLGVKHRPELLYALARALHGKATVVVLSEGIGRELLEKMPPLDNLTLLGFQAYEDVPKVLASADVLLATLEHDASTFALPSKILSYLCAGRPILLAAPSGNLSAEIVHRSAAGLVVHPNQDAEWISAARKLASDEGYRDQLGRNGRRYAEQVFDTKAIGDTFEQVLIRAGKKRAATAETELAHI